MDMQKEKLYLTLISYELSFINCSIIVFIISGLFFKS